MSKIVVVGSLHYDIMLDAPHRPEKGETVMGTSCHYKFGGKGGNQAIAAAKAGATVIFSGAVGADEQGKFLLQALKSAGVSCDSVEVISGVPSGMSVAITDTEGDYGAVIVSNANQHISCSTFRDDTFWQNVGILILQNEVPEITNINAASEARQRGIPVLINAAPARQLSPELEKHINLLLVNAVEARDMSNITVNSLDTAVQAAEVLTRRFPQVVVTAGEYGVAWCEAGHTAKSLAAKKITLISTHGAGDCFTGVLSQALIQQNSLEDAVTLANDAAARHVSQQRQY